MFLNELWGVDYIKVKKKLSSALNWFILNGLYWSFPNELNSKCLPILFQKFFMQL